VELDGPADECAGLFEAVQRICEANGTTKIRVAADDAERARIWTGRKAAFAAVGRISPDYFVQDGVVPRTRLSEALHRIGAMGEAAGLRVANVFHAGDGNLHPLVLYDERLGEHERAEKLSKEIAELCVELGGSLSGEHGIGTDKACSMPVMFGEEDLATMDRVRRSFDPDGICNPGKVLPTPRLCGERPGPYRPHPLEAAGVIERL
jgi:glycolate oxidase